MITSINNENNLNLGKHCGKKTGQTALVTGDYAVLTFHTDELEERKGFLLLFTTIPEGKLNQKTVRFFRRKELPRKENPGGELPYKDKVLVVPFKGEKSGFGTSWCQKRPPASNSPERELLRYLLEY